MSGVLELEKMLAQGADSQLCRSHLVAGPTLRGPVCLRKLSTARRSAACD